MDLDDISTDSSVGDTSPQNFKVTLLYHSEDSDTPVGSIVFSSDEDVSAKLRSGGPTQSTQTRPSTGKSTGTDRRSGDGTTPEPTSTEKLVEIKTDPWIDKLPAAALPEGFGH